METSTVHDLPPPPDLAFAAEFITADEERSLIAAMETSGMAAAAYDDTGRVSKSFGWNFDMASDSFKPGKPILPAFAELQRRAAAFAGIAPAQLIQCLLNRYDPGASIPFHFDKPKWEDIIGISLGAAVVMDFRKAEGETFVPAAAVLEPRSAYILKGAARHEYQHAILEIPERRWSITFRSGRVG